MEYVEEETCRLCLTSVSHKIIEGISNESRNKILDVLKLDLNDGQKHVMCNICSEKLHAALEFKSTCLSTEASIISYMDIEKQVLVDLRDIFVKQKGVGISDKQEICRLCMQLVKDEFTSVYELEMDIFQNYIPEMNFSITKEPVICKLCLGMLLNHTSFLKNCFAVHTKIEKSSDENITNPQIVALHSELWIKSETNEQNENTEIKVESEEAETNFEGTEVEWVSEEVFIETEKIEIKEECIEEQSLPSTHCPMDWHEAVPVVRKQNEVIGDVEHSLNINSESRLSDHKILDKKEIRTSLSNHETCSGSDKINSEIGWFVCDICGFKSKRKGHLKRHLLIHKVSSGIQWFMCDVCDYKTLGKSYLQRHMLTHENSSKIQWYKCNICDYKTVLKFILQRHMVKHVNPPRVQWFVCDICVYKSKQKGHLERHMLRHRDPSQIQWFVCHVCDFKSQRKNHLTRHMLTHSSEMQWYKCDICVYKSKRKYNLEKHLLLHTKVAYD